MAYLETRNSKREFFARLRIPTDRAVIGRAPDAAIRIDDRSVSKVHASLEPLEDGSYRLTDLGSRNGILHKGKKRNEVRLKVGEEVQIGNVVVTICGDGPQTLPIPDIVAPPPRPDETETDAKGDAGWFSILSASERRLLIVFLVLVIGLGVAVATLPDRKKPETREDETTVAAVPDKRDIEEDSDAASEAVTIPVASTVPDDGRAEWGALGRELDRQCSQCHHSSGELDFVVRAEEEGGADAEYGRWERNLLRLRAITTVSIDGESAQLEPFAGAVGAHEEAIPLELSELARRGAERIRVVPGRLLRPDPERVPYEKLGPVPAAELRRIRDVWRLLYGRTPTVDEWRGAEGRSSVDLLSAARGHAEFWRVRARRWLESHAGFAPGAPLPVTLLPDEVPEDLAAWSGTLRRLAPHSSTLTGAPLPQADGRDDAFQGWFLNALGGAPKPMTFDEYVRSVWGALWGAPPDAATRADLTELCGTLDGPLEPERLARTFATLAVHAPRTPIGPPTNGESVDAWLQGFLKSTLGRDVPEATVKEMAVEIELGTLEPRVVADVCLTSTAFRSGEFAPKPVGLEAVGSEAVGSESLGSEAPAAVAAGTPPKPDLPPVRVEVFCGFPVADLVERPSEIPKLWRRFDRSIVQLFPDDPTPLSVLWRRAWRGAVTEERVVASDPATLRSGPEDSRPGFVDDFDLRRVFLADGLLLPSFRRIADRIGDPRVAAGVEHWRGDVRRRLGLGESARVDTKSAPLIREGGFRLVANDSPDRVVGRAAPRTLVLASSLAQDASQPLAVALSMPDRPGNASGLWPDFIANLELLALRAGDRPFDLWLWGQGQKGTETLRVTWGGDIERGWVERASQFARAYHPHLRHWALPTSDLDNQQDDSDPSGASDPDSTVGEERDE